MLEDSPREFASAFESFSRNSRRWQESCSLLFRMMFWWHRTAKLSSRPPLCGRSDLFHKNASMCQRGQAELPPSLPYQDTLPAEKMPLLLAVNIPTQSHAQVPLLWQSRLDISCWLRLFPSVSQNHLCLWTAKHSSPVLMDALSVGLSLCTHVTLWGILCSGVKKTLILCVRNLA